MASADWVAKVRSSSTVRAANAPAARRIDDQRADDLRSSTSRGTASTER